MKNIYYFLWGISASLLLYVLFSISCKKDSNNEPNANAEILASAAKIEEVMGTEDTNKLMEIITQSLIDEYKGGFYTIKPKMKQFAESFKTRILVTEGDNYAEYSFEENGITFSVGLSRQDDGMWKILNF